MRSLTPLVLTILATLVSAQQDKLDDGIPAGDGNVAVFVRMTDQILKSGADYDAYCTKHKNIKRREHRVEVIKTLRAKSDASWKSLEKLLGESADDIKFVQRYWVVNGFACLATGEACHKLAKNANVSFVYRQPRNLPALHNAPKRGRRVRRPNQGAGNKLLAKKALALLEEGAKAKFPPFDKLQPTWNITRIKAVDAWKTGAFGQGITAALIDSGLVVTPALSSALWRNEKEELNGKDDDGNGFIDDLFGYDFNSNTGISIGEPGRCHGSMCGGIIAGRPIEVDGKYLVTGVAPKSRLMVIRGMGLIKSYEYALANGADIVSMSYMWNMQLGNWRGIYRLAHEHMTIAGVVSVGGSGNSGRAPRGRQIGLPKDIPCVIAASGLDQNNKMPAFSSKGPCTWDGVKFYDDFPEDKPLMKPDVTTFITGYPVWTDLRRAMRGWRKVHDAGDNVGLVVGPQGNSFSGPHAGAVAALMLSANPDLPAWRVKELMMATCKNLGKTGHDTKFGAGAVNALAAVNAARAAKTQ
jgi:subtilisin family serine protease